MSNAAHHARRCASAAAPISPSCSRPSRRSRTGSRSSKNPCTGSAGFFLGRPAVLDLSSVDLSQSAIAHLVAQLEALGIRIMGIEGADAEQLGSGLPPALRGRPFRRARSGGARGAQIQSREGADLAAARQPGALRPVDLLPEGDVTVLGSVASGAEIVAGGSIHVYGTLRGRAMAGAPAATAARIFCRKIEAELLAIDGYYRTDRRHGREPSRPACAGLARRRASDGNGA